MREITVRGKRVEYGEMVYGYLIGDDVIVGNIVEFNDEYFNTSFWYKVRPETVGEYTGLKDRNGKEIYEGDVIRLIGAGGKEYIRKVVYEKYTFHVGFLADGLCDYEDFEVIGNVHEGESHAAGA